MHHHQPHHSFFTQGETFRANESFINTSGILGTCHAIVVAIQWITITNHYYYTTAVVECNVIILNSVMIMRECYVPPPTIHLMCVTP